MTRKIILSRKGFDSGYGGMPSAFVADGEMVSFPIPHAGKYADPDLARYADIAAEGMSLRARMASLYGERFAAKLDHCHHDPDLQRGVFGQTGIAQGHLRKNGVGAGDLFLFFGWFKAAEKTSDGLRFPTAVDADPGVQALFGFLQVGEVLPAAEAAEKHPELRSHPHLTPARLRWDEGPDVGIRTRNTVYIAAKRLSLPGTDDLPGWGVFRHSPEVILTADGAKSRTVWKLRDVFRGREITYHTGKGKNPWLPNGLFQSRPRGQEFVVHDGDDEAVSKWAAALIRRCYLRS